MRTAAQLKKLPRSGKPKVSHPRYQRHLSVLENTGVSARRQRSGGHRYSQVILLIPEQAKAITSTSPDTLAFPVLPAACRGSL